MRADRRLYMDRHQMKLVPENSPESAFLVAATGQEIAPEMVKRLDLVIHEGRVMQASQVPAKATEPVAMAKPPVEPEPASEPEPAAEAPSIDPAPRIMPPESRRSRRRY
jgi:hypothetical protein